MTRSIVWDSSYETGIHDVDEQHRHLIAIVNSLGESIGTTSPARLQDIVCQLKEYAQRHFQAEESIMESQGYPDLPAHRAEHLLFVDQIMLFDLDVLLASDGLAWDMFHFLRNWLTTHILQVDMKFAAAVRA